MSLRRHLSQKVADRQNSPQWYRTSFEAQRKFIEDPAKLKTAFCTRRAGKSVACGIYLLKEAWENPHCSVLYVGLTLDAAKKIMWAPVFKMLDRLLNLGCTFRETDLSVQLLNGSVIYMTGIDSRPDDMDRQLGQKHRLVVIDEGAKYHVDLHRAIFDVFKPAVSDYEGTIAIIGTACDFTESYFARCARRLVPGWSVHEWSALDNPHMARQFRAEMKQLRDMNPNVDNEAWFQQNYLGKWVVNDRNRLYLYDRGAVGRLDQGVPSDSIKYHLAVNMPATGPMALAVVGASPHHPYSYVAHAQEFSAPDVLQAVDYAMKAAGRYEPASITLVNTGARLTEEISRRLAVPVHEPSDADHESLLRIFQAELLRGRIKVLPEGADIYKQWDSVVRDTDVKSRLVEDSRSPAHLATAALYAWNACNHVDFAPAPDAPSPFDPHLDARIARYRREAARPDVDLFLDIFSDPPDDDFTW